MKCAKQSLGYLVGWNEPTGGRVLRPVGNQAARAEALMDKVTSHSKTART